MRKATPVVAFKEKVILTISTRQRCLKSLILLGRDATFAGLTGASESLRDTLSILNKENSHLKAQLDSLSVASSSGSPDKNELIAELKQLKELLDAKILTQAEYDAKKKGNG